MKNQKGFTTIELVIVLCAVTALTGAGLCIWIVTHFVIKIW